MECRLLGGLWSTMAWAWWRSGAQATWCPSTSLLKRWRWSTHSSVVSSFQHTVDGRVRCDSARFRGRWHWIQGCLARNRQLGLLHWLNKLAYLLEVWIWDLFIIVGQYLVYKVWYFFGIIGRAIAHRWCGNSRNFLNASAIPNQHHTHTKMKRKI